MAQRIEIDGLSLAYEDTGGDGPCVLFLHGLGGSANGWLAQLRVCARRGWRGIAPDQRGAGRSGDGGDPLSIDLWARDAERLLDALAVERAAIVGHSAGCMIAVRAARRLARRAWALALCGGIAEWPPAVIEGFAERARLARAGRMDAIAEAVAAGGLSEGCRERDPRLLGLLREAIAAADGERYAHWVEGVSEGRMEGLAALECPLLALCGSEDPVTPPAAAEAIAAVAANGRSAVVPGAAHWCMIEDPGATGELILGFLDGHRPA